MCNIPKLRPNIPVFLTLVCLPFYTYNVVQNGMIGTSVSSIQNRYQLQSEETGVIVGMADVGGVLTLLLLAYVGEKLDKPKWIATSSFIMAAGIFIFAVPHFTAPQYKYTNLLLNNYCNNVTQNQCEVSSHLGNYKFVFMLSLFLIGACESINFTLGLTYIDDNSTKKKSSLHTSIFYVMSALGPATGILVGGSLTELFVHPSETNVEMNSKNPLWIGAWWPGYLVFGSLLTIVAIPMLFMPRLIPGVRESQKKESLKKKWIFIDILKNPIFILSSFAVTLSQAFVRGFTTFGVKYVEAQYGESTLVSSIIYGVTGLLAVISAHTISGLVITRKNLNLKGIMKFCIVGSFASVVFTFSFFFYCDDFAFAGGTVPYSGNTTTLGHPSSPCNENCGCSTEWYNPVRGSDSLIYYSPCFAGCKVKINKTNYANCTCVIAGNAIPDSNVLSTNSTTAIVIEKLSKSFCLMGIPFAIFFTTAFFTTVITVTPTTQITLRCVEEEQRSSALSIQQIFAVVLGNVPGRILTGKVLDTACVVWSTKCGELASCKIYKKWDMALYFFLLLITETVIIFVLYVVMFFVQTKQTKSVEKSCHNNEAYKNGDSVE